MNICPGLTYGIYILNAINEQDMIEQVWTQDYKIAANKFFSTMLDMNSGWDASAIADITTKELLSELV